MMPARELSRSVCRFAVLIGTLLLLSPDTVRSEVRRVVVESREPVLGGAPFGRTGGYEKLRGTIEFQFDPARPGNARVVDLDKAPRNSLGLVEASADFMVLRPQRPPDSGSIALVEVSNRGGKAALPYFNRATWSRDPVSLADFGDGLLMRHGLTVIWVGWQFDVPREAGLLRLGAPLATDGGRPIQGLVRADWTVDRSVITLALGHRRHLAYPVLDPLSLDNVLTVRDGRLAPRRVVPRSEWRFTPAQDAIHAPGGFEPGKIYELVYRARDPAVVGLGLAVVRDVASYAKFDPRCVFPVTKALGVGISQSGRFLRHFLYQGFNVDETGRLAFDGLLIHSAGAGRGSFNHRFAQPSRDAHRLSSFFYPTDLFPFTGRSQRDPDTTRVDGLFKTYPPSAEHLPKVFYTNTGYEYWGRAASLTHTSVDGRSDVAPLANERIYHLASGQHFVGDFPPSSSGRLDGSDAYRGNPLDFRVTLRALVVRLVEWVAENRAPPPSAYPTIAAGTLVPIDRVQFPRIPGVSLPTVVHVAHRIDFGPRWLDGVITVEPPKLGAPFPSLVSQVDDDGNENAGLRNLELLEPLATYTPWSLRGPVLGNAAELMDFLGTYIPSPRTEAERQRAGDPRRSIADRYPTKAHYLTAVARAAGTLVAAGVLLSEDVPAVVTRAERHWDWSMAR